METTMSQTLSPSNSGRRRTSNASNSPEFEFCTSFPEPNLHSADELFVDGVILPLHLLHHSDDPPDPSPELYSTSTDSINPNSSSVSEFHLGVELETETVTPQTRITSQGHDITANPKACDPTPHPNRVWGVTETTRVSTLSESLVDRVATTSKRWKDIFKKDSSGGKNKTKKEEKVNEKEKMKERKVAGGSGGGNGTSGAELNIYLWPFSRSRSAGTGGSRPRIVPAGSRKVSSAPCSRSNSASESKLRKWPSSPSRGGVHLGRSSPVWQVRRNGSGRSTADPLTRNAEKGIKKDGNDILRCEPAVVGGGSGRSKSAVDSGGFGNRHHLSRRSDDSAIGITTTDGGDTAASSQSGAGIGTSESGRGSNLFNFRSLFTKKVY